MNNHKVLRRSGGLIRIETLPNRLAQVSNRITEGVKRSGLNMIALCQSGGFVEGLTAEFVAFLMGKTLVCPNITVQLAVAS